MLYPLDTPEMSDFKDNIDRINKLAEQAPGFVWRLQTDDGDATSIDHFGDHVIVNMSTWEDHKSLYDFVFRTEHITYLKRRREWFSHMKVSSVMWWARTNSNPTIEEAAIRLQHLTDNGPSADAFTFKTLAKMPSIS
ncbi:hypothetical protein AB833_26345 [Chromatiales bacterium (ex Bugula neritina AB1)]|nr:hypothetical protein AB833_26345 [Chromatiales bacterium (ex Bugula neritina AB1)]